jgi:glycosyltransferase involved in cell wall biosynthesis
VSAAGERSGGPRVLMLTRYSWAGASSRYRLFQFVPALREAGFHVVVSPLFDDTYLANQYRDGRGRLRDYARALRARLAAIGRMGRFDLVVVEKELVPYCPALVEARILTGPYVVDYDDAIFHQYDQHPSPLVRRALGDKIAVLMRRSRLVVAGNRYLGAYASRAGAPRVEILPTVVDLDRYTMAQPKDGACFTIGWIGSPHTAKYLTPLAPALSRVCAGGRARVVLIGAGEARLPGVPVEVLPWSEATEVRDMNTFDVGIMPLTDTPWERGKCGFKLIQYMACGLPVVASPVGVNTEIVDESTGCLAASTAEWTASLEALRDDVDLRRRMGAAGRKKVEDRYCLAVAAPRMVSLLRSAAGGAASPGRCGRLTAAPGVAGRAG